MSYVEKKVVREETVEALQCDRCKTVADIDAQGWTRFYVGHDTKKGDLCHLCSVDLMTWITAR